MAGTVARVALEGTVETFDKLYTYIIPAHFCDLANPGCRVTVPFGRGNVKKQGVIFRVEKAELKGLKSITSVIDKEPVISEEMLEVCEYLRENTFCTYYDAVRAVLPAGITYRLVNYYSANTEFSSVSILNSDEQAVYNYLEKNGEKDGKEIEKTFSVLPEFLEKMVEKQALIKNKETKRRVLDSTQKWVKIAEDVDLSSQKFTPRQRDVVSLLEDVGSAFIKEITYFTGVSSAVIENLIKKGILTAFRKETYRTAVKPSGTIKQTKIELTDEQKTAFCGLLQKYKDEKPNASLLYGVTGSGKTQVFLKLVDEAVKDNCGTIVMVPEISLTPQLISIFGDRYGDKIAVFHSAMSMGRRMDEWKRIKDGKALIAIGTRSAVFAPFKNLKLIIIDEEQEHTYKSEKKPRFHARDVAMFRTQQNGGLLCLASATPSIETYTMAKRGKISLFEIKNRYGNAVLPEVETVDMREEVQSGNTGALSRRLYEALGDTLESGHQAILLLNRRGHNTYVSCPSCGEAATCPNCSITLTYHSANRRLMCHYCGYSMAVYDKCPECGCEHLKFSGLGTQKAEEELKTLFPKAGILRLDADSTVSRDSYSSYLNDFRDGKYDILLGTQMVAKGLDFPNVTLVGVLGADNAMFSEDFRSLERSFSLLTQVVGRAGRGNDKGIAIIQTANPESNIINLAKDQDYDSFYGEEILNRKLMIYPPYCDICIVSVRAVTKNDAETAAKGVFAEIKRLISEEYKDIKLIILGPAPSAVAKVNNRYRYRMIIKCRNNSAFREMIRKAINVKTVRDAVITVDMNPETII